jgi:hypothetical protein
LSRIGVFSTDWQFEKVPDADQSRIQGRQVFTTKRIASYGGTYYYRMALPFMELAKHGHECILSYAIDEATDGHIRVMDTAGEWHDDCDVVVFQRWMHEDGVDRAKKAIACGQIVINDVDDHFWALPKSNVAHKTTDPSNNPSFNRVHYRKMIEASSAIIASTETIANEFRDVDPPVFICRNAIDIERWQPHDPGADGMVGWVGGIPWRGNDLTLLCGVLRPFLEQNDLPFYHGGESDNPNYPKAWQQLGLNPERTQLATRPLVHIAEYPSLWDPVNLAVIPLEDSRFSRAKSWLKGLEASAAGIPFIASKMPEYELLGVGRLAKTAKQWRRHLEELLDPDVRRAEGIVNRRRAEELSIGNQYHQWAHVLDEVVPIREAA